MTSENITFEQYQAEAHKTAVYPDEMAIPYVMMGLSGEVGEVANKMKKVFRDQGGVVDAATKAKLIDEISDCLWYLAELCTVLGISFDGVALRNLDKLADRKYWGTLKGNGDER